MLEYLKVCRIDHWLKNVFIVFGHFVAVVLVFNLEFDGSMIASAALSLIPACLIASANYVLNEILDAPFDRLHPTKKHRGVAAGLVSVPVLWTIMAVLCVVGFALAIWWFDNPGYTVALALLLLSGLVYNVQPLRLKDRAYLDVIAESFNNPIRLWLGWYALVDFHQAPPVSIMFAWWFFGALLMTGKRYSEYRFIGDKEQSGLYRRSFRTYNEKRLVIAMITYANLFCFCTGVAMTAYLALNNLVLIFPLIVLAVIAYFHHAMSEVGAKLEPEQLLQKPLIIVSTLVTGIVAVLLLYWGKSGWFNVVEDFHLLRATWE